MQSGVKQWNAICEDYRNGRKRKRRTFRSGAREVTYTIDLRSFLFSL
jgi:hypothetical protein